MQADFSKIIWLSVITLSPLPFPILRTKDCSHVDRLSREKREGNLLEGTEACSIAATPQLSMEDRFTVSRLGEKGKRGGKKNVKFLEIVIYPSTSATGHNSLSFRPAYTLP